VGLKKLKGAASFFSCNPTMSECPICYEEINSETGSVSLSCSHQFHLTCITSWFGKQGSCPCCRKLMGEKEAVPLVQDEDKDEEYDERLDEEPRGECTNFVYLTRQEISDVVKSNLPKQKHGEYYMPDYEWQHFIDSYHYNVFEANGVDCIRFTQDELRIYLVSRTRKDLSIEIWNELLKKKMATVNLTYSEFVALQYKLTGEHYPISRYKWGSMLASNVYIKGKPTYIGEIPICFTYFHLATTILHNSGVDLRWRTWNNIQTAVPVTGAFLSASLDLAGPLRLPTAPDYVWEIESYHSMADSLQRMFSLPYDNL